MDALEFLFGGLASGFRLCFRLSDIRPDRSSAILDGAALRRFYLETDPATLPDIERANSLRHAGGPRPRHSGNARRDRLRRGRRPARGQNPRAHGRRRESLHRRLGEREVQAGARQSRIRSTLMTGFDGVHGLLAHKPFLLEF